AGLIAEAKPHARRRRGVLRAQRRDAGDERDRHQCTNAGHHFMNSGSKLKTTGRTSSGNPVGNGPNARVLDAASTAPCASRSNEKLPDRLMNVRSDTEPSR